MPTPTEVYENVEEANGRVVNIARFTSKRRTDADIQKSRSEDTRKFYSRQNGIIDLFEEVEKQSLADSSGSMTQGLDDDGTFSRRGSTVISSHILISLRRLDDRFSVKLAIRASFAVNVFLVLLKIFIAVRSNSMSVLASALDSILDIVSGSIMFVVDWLTQQYAVRIRLSSSLFLPDF